MLSEIIKYLGTTVLVIVLLVILTILCLRWVNPPFTAFSLQADWEQLDKESYDLRTEWVQYEDIPGHLIWAVIAAEDQLFFEHFGFDFESMEEAWDEHQEGVRTRGASTISQQVAKNLFLSPAQSYIRKSVEAGLTLVIELLWPKERIIEVYLNIAEFGPGIFGIGKASKIYFNKPAPQLTPEMAALFAAVLPSPKRMRVNPPSPYTKERSQWILKQMTQLTGETYITTDNNSPGKADSVGTTPKAKDSPVEPDTTYNKNQPDTLIRSIPDTQEIPNDSI
ncbi:MAG: monofunctional biosynthetic peptidoglycan transglycosylase [Balneolaceae bacterium]|nr:monofunctional biosynthetic peptidoglycan transglycosylase [Balneolaceae bacterium]